jgi:multiple sugar transport system substrate-binding protein
MLKMLGAGAAGTLLAACAPITPQVTEKVVEKIVTPTPGPITIRFPHAMGDEGQAVFEKVAAMFQEKNPNVTVKVDPTFDWDAQKYLVQAAAGTAPDILWGDEHWVYNLSSKGVLLDLNPFMEVSHFNKDDFDPLFEYFAFQGKQYGVALWSGCYVLFYNKKLFDEAGISYPTEGWTYDDVLVAAKKITRDTNGDGEPDIWGFHCQTGWANPWGALIWAFGGEYFNEDGTRFLLCEQPNYAGLQWYIDLMHKHKVAPTPEIADALAGGGDPFMLGVIGLKTGSPWRMVTYRKITDFEWDVAGMPTGPKGRYSALTTDSLSIYRGSQAPEVAWAFIEELLTEEAAKLYCTEFKGPVPALKAGQKYFILPDQPPANQRAFIDAVSYAKVPFQSPYSYVVEDLFYQALGAASDGLKTLDEAMSGVCEPINTALAEEVEKVKAYGLP